MLQFIRERSEGWFAWTIVIAVVITFVLWGIHSYFYSNQRYETVASVNGVKITSQQLSNIYEYLKRAQESALGSKSLKQPKEVLEKIALQSLISNLVLTQTAQKSGFYVSEAMIASNIVRMPIFQEKGSFSKDRFQKVISRMGMSFNEFESSMTSNFLIDQVQLGLVHSAFALPKEIQQMIQLIEQKRSFEYSILSINQFFKQAIISDSEIKTYYQSHEDDFRIPEKVSIQYVLLSAEDLKKKIHPTESELKDFFSSNPSLFHYKEGNGQELLWKDIKEKVLPIYQQQKVQQQFLEFSDQLANMTYENPSSLEQAAQQLKLKIQTSPLFPKEGGTDAITKNPKVVAMAFSPDVLEQSNNSEPINLNDSTVMVLRIKDHKPTQIKPLISIRSEIIKQLTQEKAKILAQNRANEIASYLNQKKGSLLSIAPNLIWKSVVAARRYERNLDSAVLNAVFNLPRHLRDKVVVASLSSGDTAIIRVNKIQDGTLDTSKSKFLSQQMANNFGLMDYQLYVQNCIQSSKVVIKKNTDHYDPRDS